jgi:hypothetical protein
MYMAKHKTQLSEGILVTLVDNFFKSLQKGVSDKYLKAAEKAEVHPEVIDMMKKIHIDGQRLDKLMKKHHLK